MKKAFYFIVLILTLASTSVTAQNITPDTGDNELDKFLSDVNIKANADLKLFKKQLSVDFSIAESKLEQLMVGFKLQPYDIFLILQMGKILGKPVDDVCKVYDMHKGKGWGVIAKELGIKPGSKEFHMLKDSAKGKSDKMKGKGNAKGKGNSNGKGNGKEKAKGKNK